MPFDDVGLQTSYIMNSDEGKDGAAILLIGVTKGVGVRKNLLKKKRIANHLSLDEKKEEVAKCKKKK